MDHKVFSRSPFGDEGFIQDGYRDRAMAAGDAARSQATPRAEAQPSYQRATVVEREPGECALRALKGAESDALLAVMLRPSFKLAGATDMVPVILCRHCGDGGLRTAGSVKTRTGREQVRACDTCGTVEIGPIGRASVLKLPERRKWA